LFTLGFCGMAIETPVNTTLERAWDAWLTPADIMPWNFASDDWCCPKAEIDLRIKGKFSYRMPVKDGAIGFDFSAVFTKVKNKALIEYQLEDNRKVVISFSESAQGIKVVEIFKAEDEHTGAQQKQGWQGILNNFKRYVEK